MLYAIKLCVLTVMVFLTLTLAFAFGWMAWPLFVAGRFNFFTVIPLALCITMLASGWYLIGCYRFIKKPEWYEDTNTPHTILGQGDNRRELHR